MFQRITAIVIIVSACFLLSNNIIAKDKSFYDNKDSQIHFRATSDSINLPVINWPAHYGVQQTGKINSIFYDNGTFGTGFSGFDGPGPLISTYGGSFETPAFSHIEYLFGGAIWIGAVVGNDTLVSTSADGWNIGFEEFGGNSVHEPTMEKIKFPSDYSLRAEFMDTFTVGIQNDMISGLPHTPLNIRVVNRSHIWRNDTLDNAIYYDYVLDYVGPEDKLDSVYIGFYFDADVGLAATQSFHNDDVVGSIQNKGIGYIIDNDGDPTAGSFDDNSPLKVFAFELITSSFVPTDTNFNWWVSGVGDNDFGPRLKGSIPANNEPFRDFGTGGTGTPVGDANKYYMMSHNEWDYDIVSWKYIDTSIWISLMPTFPDEFASTDVRFLYSIGPFTLEKGKPERIIVSTFTADSVHIDPNNIDNLPDNPGQYNANLNLENIIAVGDRIRLHVDSILNPLNPPTGLVVYDSNKIRFDTYCFPDVTSHELYATPVDASSFPFPGAVPPWYIPPFPNHIGTSIFEIPLNDINGITAVNVAYTSAHGTSELSGTRFINYENNAIPTVQPVTTTTTADSIVLAWTLPANSSQPAYYNIYKYATYAEFNTIYTKPFYFNGQGNSYTTDSIEVDGNMWFYQSALEPPYAQVNGDETKFIDHNFDDSYLYFIVSVDSNGFESDYNTTTGYLLPERTKDLLIVTNKDKATLSTTIDSIVNYYATMMSGIGFDVDIAIILDSLGLVECNNSTFCPEWQYMSQYKYILIDESEYSEQYWIGQLENYLINGGKLINFGCLPKLFNLNHNTNPGWYTISPSYSKIFGVDSIFTAGHLYNYPNTIEENKFGFNVAKSIDGWYTSLECDTAEFPLDNNWVTIVNDFPTNEPLQITGFGPSENSTVTHLYQSLYPTTSYMQDLPVGLKHTWSDEYYSFETYTYGFHLYYMKQDQARDLLRSIILKIPTDVKSVDTDNLPTEFSLSQNYPNPFNPTTTIQFNLPERSHVTLTVYNLLGQKVTQLVNKEYPAGNYKVAWDATNSTDHKVSSGLYLYRLETDAFKSTKKMVLLK